MRGIDTAFETCLELLPRHLRSICLAYCQDKEEGWEEIRLRAGRGLTLLRNGREYSVVGNAIAITQRELHTVLELATNSSYQSACEQLGQGFYTVKGGHRIGISGSVTLRDGMRPFFRELSSLNIRVAREKYGIGDALKDLLLLRGFMPGTLILSPPGGGKTTLLRELIRLLSDEYGLRVALADERSEVAAMWKGIPQMNVGSHTDIMDGCLKAKGMLMLLRCMNPSILAADEITVPEDIQAVSMAANCGVSVLATAHASDLDELRQRPLYHKLLAEQVFTRAILIRRGDMGGRLYEMVDISC